MKVEWNLFFAVLLALVVYRFVDKMLLGKVDSMFSLEQWERE